MTIGSGWRRGLTAANVSLPSGWRMNPLQANTDQGNTFHSTSPMTTRLTRR